jgi:hypothetical protein
MPTTSGSPTSSAATWRASSYERPRPRSRRANAYHAPRELGGQAVARVRAWQRLLNVRGYNIVVFGSRKGWGIKIEQRYGDRRQFGLKRYATRAEAQAAAFRALLWAEQAWAGNGRYDPVTTAQPQPGD